MTYTTAHKTYSADTLPAAAAMMLFDEQVWNVFGSGTDDERDRIPFNEAVAFRLVMGRPKGYSVESWEWDAEKHELTVHFR